MRFRFLVLLIFGSWAVSAHDLITTKITFSREISRIFLNRCLSCHHDGGNTPLSLQTYEQARPWAKAIKEEVLTRRMPPWGAVKGFGDIHPDPSLTQEEILRISQWVEGGAPEGDPALLPPMNAPIPPTAKFPSSSVKVARDVPLQHSLRVIGLEPKADVSSARVWAVTPEGKNIPLVWLYNYEAKGGGVFWFREPIVLAKGSMIRSDQPVELRLRTSTSAVLRAR